MLNGSRTLFYNKIVTIFPCKSFLELNILSIINKKVMKIVISLRIFFCGMVLRMASCDSLICLTEVVTLKVICGEPGSEF